MRPGNLTRWAGTAGLVSFVLLLGLPAQAPDAAAAKPATDTSISSLGPSPSAAAVVADGPTIFTIEGTPFPTRITAVIGPAGRLTLVSPEGITAPATPMGECTQDSATQVSCLPDYVDAIVGDLKGGADTFTAGSTVLVQVGVPIEGFENPLIGGAGSDRITGGAFTDYVEGGAGADTLIGNDSSDLIRGGPGPDQILGGVGIDALFGGGGSDAFDGGPGRDLCSGGGGVDTAVDCFVRKKIP
ncbi:MAG: hypothetical protein H0V15_04030 [Solirubrobacterales bacterium]|nr:hypothetical protein [Solirubrobacterales bacterium]